MIYVEVSTLFEQSWSGIANVTAGLCRALIERGESVRFFALDRLLKNAFVETALAVREGAGLKLMFDSDLATEGRLLTRPNLGDNEIGIYPNFRRGYQRFAKQVLIVHDISFSLMPELHRPGAEEYAYRVYNDAHQVDHVCCVSEASRRDLITYYHVPPEKVSVAHPGIDIDVHCNGSRGREHLDDLRLTPRSYFLVLGTIEPRKNVGLVLQFLRDNPELLRKYKFVFVGRDGWGKTFRELCIAHGIDNPRVIHLGYVSDSMCKPLLRNCLALVYPSLFEGFGMPVTEAMAAGVPVLVSRSSSLVELGVDDEWLFDPCSLDSFAETFERFLQLSSEARASIGAANRSRATRFTWSAFAEAVLCGAQGLTRLPMAVGSAGAAPRSGETKQLLDVLPGGDPEAILDPALAAEAGSVPPNGSGRWTAGSKLARRRAKARRAAVQERTAALEGSPADSKMPSNPADVPLRMPEGAPIEG